MARAHVALQLQSWLQPQSEGMIIRRRDAGVFDAAGQDAAWGGPDTILRDGPSGAETGPTDCCMSNAGTDKKWKARFAWTDELSRLNKDIFGNNGFRPNQQQAINATLARKDVFLLMPTGGGGFDMSFQSYCISAD